ncbi:MAG: SDR family oxidoreductase [Anaerolineae bacterium]|nr:SDR family oxidoreductase [Anaerolineae bacterium]
MNLAPSALRPDALAGRVALVTGVSRRIGIGFAIAQRLLGAGATVFVQSWQRYDAGRPWGDDDLQALLAQLRKAGRVEHAEADFSDPAAPGSLMEQARTAFGHVDILIANHAYSTMGDLTELTAEQVDRHMAVNVRATLLLAQAFAAQHDGRPGGRVILMTSGQHSGPMSGELAYVASKAALHGLTTSLSAHLIRRGITVNTVNPGATDTGYATGELFDAVQAASPQGRWGMPDDAARLIAWLVTDDAQWVTGQVINSTGGM